MSSESYELDYYSSSKDDELKVSPRSSDGSSDSGSYFTAASELSSKESETEEHEIDDVALSDFNTSDENQHGFDIKSVSFSSLKGISQEDLSGTTKSSGLTRNVSSQTVPSTKRASSPDSLKGQSTRRVSSVDPLEGSSTIKISPMDQLEGPITGRVSPVHSLEGSSTRISHLDPLEETSTRISFEDPLEGSSTKKTWVGRQAGSSFTSIYRLNNSENEINVPSISETPTDQNGCFRMLTWSSLRRYSRQIILSKYYLLFHVALFYLPISAAYMSLKYYPLCGACPPLPVQLYMQGILGMCLLTFRLASIVSKLYFTPHLTGHEMDNCLLYTCAVFFGLLFVVMLTIHSCNPVFLPGVSTMKHFCYKGFYYYAYRLNVGVLLIFLLLVLIHVPGCVDPEEDGEEEEDVDVDEDEEEWYME